MAQQIMVVRHAEKPDATGNERGLDEHGHDDPRGLTVRGWQRAGALVRFFAPLEGQRFTAGLLATPKAIFAVAPHASSQRPTLTVQPLGQLLGLTVDSRFGSEDVPSLALAAVRAEGPVLICWRHNHMAAIAKQLCPWVDPGGRANSMRLQRFRRRQPPTRLVCLWPERRPNPESQRGRRR